MKIDAELTVLLASLAALFIAICAYITHIIWIVTTFSTSSGITFGQFVLSVFGLFIPPVGMLHGMIIWLGALF